MMNGKVTLFIILVVCSFGISCKKINTISDYDNWLNKPKHGCIKSQHIAGAEVSVKYQPSSYLVLKQFKSGSVKFTESNRDSLFRLQDKMMTFLMTVGPDEAKIKDNVGSVMNHGVENYSQYADRVMTSNFFMDQHVKLYIDGVAVQPAMAIMDNVYELSDKRTFVIVFADNKILNAGREYLFVYDDPFFNMGKVQFSFTGTDLRRARNVEVHW